MEEENLELGHHTVLEETEPEEDSGSFEPKKEKEPDVDPKGKVVAKEEKQ
jgi:hypothetical protein